MRAAIKIDEDFMPVSEFKANAASVLARAREHGTPVVITQNGRPAGVFLSPAAYEELVEQARFLASVREGLADADGGRVLSSAALKRRLAGKTKARRQKG